MSKVRDLVQRSALLVLTECAVLDGDAAAVLFAGCAVIY